VDRQPLAVEALRLLALARLHGEVGQLVVRDGQVPLEGRVGRLGPGETLGDRQTLAVEAPRLLALAHLHWSPGAHRPRDVKHGWSHRRAAPIAGWAEWNRVSHES
jgi:hypothetical protein